jgi:GNAT superfamily N-acetyltransferase/predicted transcriptional regulator
VSDELFLEIGIGTRCRRNFERLSSEIDNIYKAENVDMSAREFPIVYCVLNRGPLTIADIQKLSGLSHSAISQTVKKLVAKDILFLEKGEDARSKIVAFTDAGNALIEKLTPMWEMARDAMSTALDECNTNILDAFADYEAALENKSFTQRYYDQKNSKAVGKIEVIPYDVKYREYWRIINQKWIETLFEMEQEDIINLNDPEKYVLDKGGEIYFALLDGEPVGAIALKKFTPTRFELSKMGVLEEARGHGIGNLLVEKVLERFKARGGKVLFLETNSSLVPAITLYKKYGFKEVPPPENTPYARADYFMELRAE